MVKLSSEEINEKEEQIRRMFEQIGGYVWGWLALERRLDAALCAALRLSFCHSLVLVRHTSTRERISMLLECLDVLQLDMTRRNIDARALPIIRDFKEAARKLHRLHDARNDLVQLLGFPDDKGVVELTKISKSTLFSMKEIRWTDEDFRRKDEELVELADLCRCFERIFVAAYGSADDASKDLPTDQSGSEEVQ